MEHIKADTVDWQTRTTKSEHENVVINQFVGEDTTIESAGSYWYITIRMAGATMHWVVYDGDQLVLGQGHEGTIEDARAASLRALNDRLDIVLGPGQDSLDESSDSLPHLGDSDEDE